MTYQIRRDSFNHIKFQTLIAKKMKKYPRKDRMRGWKQGDVFLAGRARKSRLF